MCINDVALTVKGFSSGLRPALLYVTPYVTKNNLSN